MTSLSAITLSAGFDVGDFPGLDKMESLIKNTCLHWCGYYLNKHPSWDNNYTLLRNMGWGVAPIYLGQSTHLPADRKHPNNYPNPAFEDYKNGKITKETQRFWRQQLKGVPHAEELVQQWNMIDDLFQMGLFDGYKAASLADANDFPASTVIYFDMESHSGARGDFWFPQWHDYYRGWCEAVSRRGYRHGLYGYAALLDAVIAKWLTPSKFSVLGYPFVWSTRFPFEGRPDADGTRHGVLDFTVTDENIYKGIHDSTVTSSHKPSPVILVPSTELNYRGDSSWQFAGNITLHWRDTLYWRVRKNEPHKQWADLSFSQFLNPGMPEQETP